MVRNLNGWVLNRTTMDHPNSERVRYSSLHCIRKVGVLSEEYSENIYMNFVPGSQSRMMAWPDKVSVPSLLLNIASKTSANLKQ